MLKDLMVFNIDDLVLYDLDNPEKGYFEYSSEYDNYFVWQVYADELNNNYKVCVDISLKNPDKL